MKNEKEFRDAVYEKARLYEKKRTARRRRLLETAALCSVCVVIGLSAWLVIPNSGFEEDASVHTTESKSGTDGAENTSDTGKFQEGLAQSTMEGSTYRSTAADATYTTEAPLFTATTAISTTAFGTETTNSPRGTEFLLEEDVPSSAEDTVHHVTADRSFTLSGSIALRTRFAVLKGTEDLLAELNGLGERLSEFDRREIENTYDDTFFEENVLIFIPRHMTYEGYEVWFRSGGASEINSVGKELSFKPYMLHTYVIPRENYDDLNHLKYPHHP